MTPADLAQLEAEEIAAWAKRKNESLREVGREMAAEVDRHMADRLRKAVKERQA